MGNRAVVVNAWDLFLIIFLHGLWSTSVSAAPVMAKRWDVYFMSASPLPATIAAPHVPVVKVREEIDCFKSS